MPTAPGPNWTRDAKAALRAALEPLLREMKLRGSFPAYRRAATTQTELVALDVRTRTGITIEVQSLPPRSKQGTWRSERQRRVLAQIRSSIAPSALPRRLAPIARRFQREAEAFWRENAGHWALAARTTRAKAVAESDAIVKALLAGNASKLATLTRELDAESFLAAVEGPVWLANGNQIAPALWKCAPVLLRYPWLNDKIGAALTASAAAAPASERKRQVEAWTRPHLGRLAPEVAFAARRALHENTPKNRARSLAIFSVLLELPKPLANLAAAEIACLLYVLVHTPAAKRPTPAVMRRVLDGAAAAARTDPHVRLNLTSLRGELPPSAARLPWEVIKSDGKNRR